MLQSFVKKFKGRKMNNENQYDFDIIEIIKAGFARIDGVKLQFVLAMLIYIVIAVVVHVILGFIFPSVGSAINPVIVAILSYPVLMPIMTGIMMMGLKHVRGEPVEFKSILNYYHLTGKLSLGAILIYIMTLIGILLFILPGIYLAVAYMFALPLIADKNMGVWEAMEYSRKKVTEHWFKVFGLTLLLGIITMISAIPFGIGLVWTLPLTFVTVYGLLYSVIFDD